MRFAKSIRSILCWRGRLVATVLVLTLLPGSLLADPTLTLTTSADLSNLTVGETVSIEVALSNIGDSPTGDLGFLAATVQWNGALLGTPAISQGPIVPDATGVLSSAAAGMADYSYDNLFSASGDPIAADGVFFSFLLAALGPGSGTISFTFVGGDDSNFDLANISASNPLSFTIAPASDPVAVPEPASWLLWTALAAVLILNRFRGLSR